MMRSAALSLNRRHMLQVLASGAVGVTVASQGAACHAEDFPARTDLDSLYDKEVDEAIRKGLALLVSRQNPDGSFLSNDWGRDAGVCALVGLALLSRGVRSGFGPPGKCLQLIGNYLAEHAQESGMVVVTGSPSHGQMYGHGLRLCFCPNSTAQRLQRTFVRS